MADDLITHDQYVFYNKFKFSRGFNFSELISHAKYAKHRTTLKIHGLQYIKIVCLQWVTLCTQAYLIH